MKKGIFYQISNMAIYISMLFILLVIFSLFQFDADQKKVSVEDKLDSHVAETVAMGYLKQNVSADVDGDGEVDARTVADLIVLGYENKNARERFKSLTEQMLQEKSDTLPYGVEVIYPDKEIQIPDGAGNVQEDRRPSVTLPLPDGGQARVVLHTREALQDAVENIEVAQG